MGKIAKRCWNFSSQTFLKAYAHISGIGISFIENNEQEKGILKTRNA